MNCERVCREFPNAFAPLLRDCLGCQDIASLPNTLRSLYQDVDQPSIADRIDTFLEKFKQMEAYCRQVEAQNLRRGSRFKHEQTIGPQNKHQTISQKSDNLTYQHRLEGDQQRIVNPRNRQDDRAAIMPTKDESPELVCRYCERVSREFPNAFAPFLRDTFGCQDIASLPDMLRSLYQNVDQPSVADRIDTFLEKFKQLEVYCRQVEAKNLRHRAGQQGTLLHQYNHQTISQTSTNQRRLDEDQQRRITPRDSQYIRTAMMPKNDDSAEFVCRYCERVCREFPSAFAPFLRDTLGCQDIALLPDMLRYLYRNVDQPSTADRIDTFLEKFKQLEAYCRQVEAKNLRRKSGKQGMSLHTTIKISHKRATTSLTDQRRLEEDQQRIIFTPPDSQHGRTAMTPKEVASANQVCIRCHKVCREFPDAFAPLLRKSLGCKDIASLPTVLLSLYKRKAQSSIADRIDTFLKKFKQLEKRCRRLAKKNQRKKSDSTLSWTPPSRSIQPGSDLSGSYYGKTERRPISVDESFGNDNSSYDDAGRKESTGRKSTEYVDGPRRGPPRTCKKTWYGYNDRSK